MRYFCWFCHKSVTSELPDNSVIRALLVCPECIQNKEILFPNDDPPTKVRGSRDNRDKEKREMG